MATQLKKTLLDLWIAQGAREFFSTTVMLDPGMAADLLSRNTSNRALTQSRVQLYASDMLADKWAFNGEPIIVSKDGLLTNGQHRCAAVLRANKSIKTVMSFGVDYETRKTTDQLRPKNAGDYAGMDGIPNAQGVAAIAAMAIAYQNTGSINSRTITHGQVLEYIHKHQTALEHAASYSHARARRLNGIAPPSVVGFCHYVTGQICPTASDEYIAQIVNGDGLSLNDPALVVRNRLVSIGKASRAAKVELILHGWNAYRRGQLRTMVKVMGKIPELV